MGTNDRKKGSQYVQLHHWLLDSKAWGSLPASSRALYVELKKRYNGYNNGQIGFSVREAGPSINIHFKTVGKYFRELEKKGFIVARYQATFNTSKGNRATEWEITEYPVIPEKTAKKLFMNWYSSKDNFSGVYVHGCKT